MELDRLGPAARDACTTRTTGRQTWRDLLFLHFEVPTAALRSLLPRALEVDTFEGRAYVGVVPFTMHDVRFGPIPIADFLELNVRTYVHAGGVPGVWFFSLDADSALAVMGARAFFRLPYYRARMKSVTADGATDYRSLRTGPGDAALDARWTVIDPKPHAAVAGTLEHFLTERYALYGPRGEGVYRVRVHHPAWPLHRARVDRFTTSILRAGGIAAEEPIDLVLASPAGVAVQTFANERVPGG